MQKARVWGPLVTVTIALIPTLLWLIFSPNHSDPLIKMAALAGLSLLSFNIILSARLSVFDRLFFGLDRMYRAHRLIGGIVVILLLLHVELLTLKYTKISLSAAYDFILPSLSDLALLMGKLSLYVLVTLTALIFYIRLRYQWFVMSMRVLGAVIFTAGYHALFVGGSDVRRTPALLAYMILLGGSAAFIYLYRSIFHRHTTPVYQYKVVSTTPRGAVTDIRLQATGRPLRRYAGQFAFLRFTHSAVINEQHPFTISAGSNDQNLRFCIKNLGDFTATLPHLKPGDLAEVEGPFGTFSFTKLTSRKQTWVAGGIGITPFLAMAHSLPSGYDVTLYYSVPTKAEGVFLEELRTIQQNTRGFRVIPFFNDKDGLLTAQHVYQNSPADDYLLCGPPGMMHALQTGLIKEGVPKNRVHFEEFKLT